MDPLTLTIVLYFLKSLHQYHISKLSLTLFLLLSISLFVVYIVNLYMVRPRSCRDIYYLYTPTLGRRHQLIDRVKFLASLPGKVNYYKNYIFYFTVFSFLFFYLTFVLFLFSFLFFSSILFSSYTCMRVWSRLLSCRLCRVSSSFSENMAQEENQSLHNENNENNRVRTLRDHMNFFFF